ncbi:MAG: DUF3293 domain-containing protein [Nitrosomonadaceae bacterium]|nr:DUF3293 domain-containing protein [Nitrosomonadaceae bacterium]
MPSDIPADLIARYRAADYRAGSDSAAIMLRIDQYSESLSQLFAASGQQCAVFITACNPGSQPCSLEMNRAAHTRLRDELSRHASQVIEGTGSDPSGAWPPEQSLLALGVDLATAQALGRQFGQNAIVWAGADAIPRLVLLR